MMFTFFQLKSCPYSYVPWLPMGYRFSYLYYYVFNSSFKFSSRLSYIRGITVPTINFIYYILIISHVDKTSFWDLMIPSSLFILNHTSLIFKFLVIFLNFAHRCGRNGIVNHVVISSFFILSESTCFECLIFQQRS